MDFVRINPDESHSGANCLKIPEKIEFEFSLKGENKVCLWVSDDWLCLMSEVFAGGTNKSGGEKSGRLPVFCSL
jgi:hypothetical protein